MKVRTHTLASQGSVPISGHNGTELGVTAVLNVSTHSLQVESGCRPEVSAYTCSNASSLALALPCMQGSLYATLTDCIPSRQAGRQA